MGWEGSLWEKSVLFFPIIMVQWKMALIFEKVNNPIGDIIPIFHGVPMIMGGRVSNQPSICMVEKRPQGDFKKELQERSFECTDRARAFGVWFFCRAILGDFSQRLDGSFFFSRIALGIRVRDFFFLKDLGIVGLFQRNQMDGWMDGR